MCLIYIKRTFIIIEEILGDLISDRYMEDKTTKKMGQQLTPRSGGALLQERKYDHGPRLTL